MARLGFLVPSTYSGNCMDAASNHDAKSIASCLRWGSASVMRGGCPGGYLLAIFSTSANAMALRSAGLT